ncbi:hypothetical protein [Streptomyces sp. NPDC059278]|uniref:hypothetical protein n=1 Tax=Streptomyces sp. NPDC059278 TaxID=3346801 RepID=UPI003684060E
MYPDTGPPWQPAALRGNCSAVASVHAVHGPAAKGVTVHTVVLDPVSGSPS